MPEPSSIPPRSWLYGGHYIRGVATATVAPGGFGKTTLTLFECLNMAVSGLNVWYLSGEDPRVEIDRRIAAHCQIHGITGTSIGGRLFVDDRESFKFFIGKARRNGVEFDLPALTAFEAAIVADHIDVVALDPFVGFHGVPEVDNNAIDGIVKKLGSIAARTNSCIEISHHVRKPAQGQMEITVDDARGGSAIVNAVRSCRVINRMTTIEAEQAGNIKSTDRHLYIRVDRGKRNMAPPEGAEWYRIRSVFLPNTDNVQAITHWEFPKTFDGLSVADIAWVQNLVAKGDVRVDPRSDAWLGLYIADRLELDRDNLTKGDCIRINKIIKVWKQNGVIAEVTMPDPASRKEKKFFAPASASPPRTEHGTVRTIIRGGF